MIRAPYDQCPTIYVYDRYPGGIGIARRLFAIDRQVLRAAWEILMACPCKTGCPSCVGPRLESEEHAKDTAKILLKAIRGEL
jgi:DEAD/DEAH box helicase domain-containing protein